MSIDEFEVLSGELKFWNCKLRLFSTRTVE